jgi:hypothetical protein
MNNHNIITRQVSHVFIVLNRIYKGISKTIINTGTEIINRIFESITITYQQTNQDVNINTEIIITTFDNHIKKFTDILISNFNILKIDFQTINRNEQMILLSNNDIKTKSFHKKQLLNMIGKNIKNIPNILKFIFEETIISFINTQSDENNSYLLNLEQNINQEFNTIRYEIQNQRKEYNNFLNKVDGIENIERNHHKIMIEEFSEVKKWYKTIATRLNP